MESAASIQTLSREIIKPSSPTPHNNRKMKLSYLDQMYHYIYVPLIFFYESKESFTGSTHSTQSQISKCLKQSLSNTLTSFYPVAGTSNPQDSSIWDCNDASGVEFIEARARANLTDIIHKHNMEDDLLQYLPFDPTGWPNKTPAAVMLTFFNCGGISIGICFSHELGDLQSVMAFVNVWASVCRGETDFSHYSFDLGNYFPARDLPEYVKIKATPFDENSTTKRFVFNEETLMALNREATSPLVTNPTKVESVTAFIWKHLIEAASASKKIFLSSHAVNFRKRSKVSSHSLENTFGNCLMGTAARYEANGIDVSNVYHELVSRLRNSVLKINEDYVLKAQTGDDYLNYIMKTICIVMGEESIEMHHFVSWRGFPLYGVNFGWGNPTWVCTIGQAPNIVILMDTKCGKSLEAWIRMEKDKLEMLDAKIKLFSTSVVKGMN